MSNAEIFDDIVENSGCLFHFQNFQPNPGHFKTDKKILADENQTQHKFVIYVDTREFRSDLPPILNKYGLEVIAKTLKYGDYR